MMVPHIMRVFTLSGPMMPCQFKKDGTRVINRPAMAITVSRVLVEFEIVLLMGISFFNE